MQDYKKYFYSGIRNNFPAKADTIIAELEKNVKFISPDIDFASSSKNPLDKRLDVSSWFLALIKTLDEQGETFEMIRKICLEVVIEYVRPKNKFQAWMKKIPAKIATSWIARIMIKSLNKKVSKKAHPDGFVANIITDKEETFGLGYGFDILECGICKLFKKYSYEKYASILCEVDEITSGLAGLQLVRTSTIAWGAKKCDFRFKRENKN